jgi:hypothetical protein
LLLPALSVADEYNPDQEFDGVLADQAGEGDLGELEDATADPAPAAEPAPANPAADNGPINYAPEPTVRRDHELLNVSLDNIDECRRLGRVYPARDYCCVHTNPRHKNGDCNLQRELRAISDPNWVPFVPRYNPYSRFAKRAEPVPKDNNITFSFSPGALNSAFQVSFGGPNKPN